MKNRAGGECEQAAGITPVRWSTASLSQRGGAAGPVTRTRGLSAGSGRDVPLLNDRPHRRAHVSDVRPAAPRVPRRSSHSRRLFKGAAHTRVPRHNSARSPPSMRPLTFGLTLARHGETQYNKLGLLQGQAIDSALSEVGLQQAEAAGRYLKDVQFSNVFVSDMLRAQQTAETIMKHSSSCSGLQMACDPLLKEMSFGIAEGGRVQDMREMAKAAGQSFPGFTPPGGETQEQVKERVKAFLEKMLQQMGAEHWDGRGEDDTSLSAPPETSPVEGQADDGVRGVPVHALVVTHGAYMCVAVRYFVEELSCSLPPGSDKAHMFSLSPNTGLDRFILTMRKEDDRFKLSRIHCVFVHRGDHVKQ